MKNLNIILASASPRRRTLLAQAGVRFSVRAADVDETLTVDERADPEKAAAKLADRKAGAVTQELLGANTPGIHVIIGADTMVVLDGEIFGKPKGIDDAKRMLRALSGRTHQVMTGVAVYMINAANPELVNVGRTTFTDISNVTFKELTDDEIAEYLKKGESFDKAGAYAAQGEGAAIIDHVEGAMDTVIGLPVGRLLEQFPDLAH